MKDYIGVIVTGLFALVLIIAAPFTLKACNEYNYNLQKIDDATNYQTIKKVEDTCRSMISSYNSDRLVYEQYKDSESEEKQSWAEQAKMRANKTASTYNEYILKNSFVWEGNVPSDIKEELQYID